MLRRRTRMHSFRVAQKSGKQYLREAERAGASRLTKTRSMQRDSALRYSGCPDTSGQTTSGGTSNTEASRCSNTRSTLSSIEKCSRSNPPSFPQQRGKKRGCVLKLHSSVRGTLLITVSLKHLYSLHSKITMCRPYLKEKTYPGNDIPHQFRRLGVPIGVAVTCLTW